MTPPSKHACADNNSQVRPNRIRTVTTRYSSNPDAGNAAAPFADSIVNDHSPSRVASKSQTCDFVIFSGNNRTRLTSIY